MKRQKTTPMPTLPSDAGDDTARQVAMLLMHKAEEQGSFRTAAGLSIKFCRGRTGNRTTEPVPDKYTLHDASGALVATGDRAFFTFTLTQYVHARAALQNLGELKQTVITQ